MHKVLLLITSLALLLTGCTYDADRIYTVCKIDNDVTYVYSDSGVYSVSNNELVPCYDINIAKKPALKLFATDKDYSFEYVLPGLYKGTLEDVSSYVQYLTSKDSASYSIISADPNNLEIVVTSSKYSARVIYNTTGDVRVYFIDNSKNFIEPLYIIERK